MPFDAIPGLPGKIYVPEQPPKKAKKHSCPDCYSCQMCCDDRCRVCRCSGSRPADSPLITVKTMPGIAADIEFPPPCGNFC